MANTDTPGSATPLRYAVTGAGGYVGSAIVEYLRGLNATVYELRRGVDETAAPYVREFSLQQIRPGVLDDVDVLIHAAYDFRASSPAEIEQANVAGSIHLFEAARAARVNRVIFISSISAFEGCKSKYGQAKLRVEHRAAELGVTIVRPGLVYGPRPGGMVAALEKLTSLPLLCPMVGNGSALQYLVHQNDLARLMSVLGDPKRALPGRPVIAANRQGKTLKQIMLILGEKRGKTPRFVGVPPWLIGMGLRSLEACGLRPRLRSDSLVGLLNQDPSPDFSSADGLGVSFRPFDTQTLLDSEERLHFTASTAGSAASDPEDSVF